MVQGGMALIKYLIFGFNLLFVIMGLAFIIVGGLTLHESTQFQVVVGDLSVSAAVLVIVIGVLIFLIAFFGCCGAIKENHCMTMTFSVLLFIILILEIAAAASAYVYRDKVSETVKDNMVRSMEKYNDDKVTKQAWDEMQHKMKCCGFNGTESWKSQVPTSCCKENVESFERCKSEDIFREGCFKKMEDGIHKHLKAIGISAIVFLFLQLLGIVCACCLANAIKKQYEVV